MLMPYTKGMSAIGVNRWLNMDHSARRKKITDYYKHKEPEQVDDFLSLVRAQHGYGVYASIGPNYQYAIFGRDSIAVAEDFLEVRPALAKEVILMLAHLQGQQFDLVSEEEPGKIHHEYRSLYFSGHKVPKAAQLVFKRLAPHWGGSETEMLYFGAYDSTPMFVRLVYKYCALYGMEILDREVEPRNGAQKTTLRQHVRDATEWFVEKVTASPWKLLEYRRLNPEGLYNQVWQDSEVAYVHADGTIANSDNGVAAVEVQGYVYDALRGAAEMVAADENEANSWRHLASIVRNNTLERMWMDKEKYFAMGLDRDNSGKTRHIATFSSNPALLLTSDMLRLTPHQRVWQYIESIVKTMFSEDFITPAGLRLRALSQADLVTFADYHGSLVSWPKQTYAVSKGLRDHGFYKLAALLEDCFLQSIAKSGEFYEFYFIDKSGNPKYHYRHDNPEEPALHEFGAANIPEPGQAWTISAAINAMQNREKSTGSLPVLAEIQKLEEDILKQNNIWALIQKINASELES
jgi:glycogen debranching enzyme